MLSVKNIEWVGRANEGHLRLLDQTRLPAATEYLDCQTVEHVVDAIRRLSVRGAPAIGIAAAYGCVIGVQAGTSENDRAKCLALATEVLAASRPTAVNLFWALDRMKCVSPNTPEALLEEAIQIHQQDAAMCRKIGQFGLDILQQHTENGQLRVLTHCNAGALATGGVGTATAPIYLANERGQPVCVVADETRPLLQGARLTAYELASAGIDVTVICDSMAAQVMREGRVRAVITGADRIAANGDAANKIGTYNLAILARHHGLPFYVAAPASTFDLSIPSGNAIPIEERAGTEILPDHPNTSINKTDAPTPHTYNPAFDVTPHDLITAIITDRGTINPVSTQNISNTLSE